MISQHIEEMAAQILLTPLNETQWTVDWFIEPDDKGCSGDPPNESGPMPVPAPRKPRQPTPTTAYLREPRSESASSEARYGIWLG